MTKEEILSELENVKEKEKDKKYFTGELNIYAMLCDVIDFINQQDKDFQRLKQSIKAVGDRYRTLDRKYTKLRKGNYYLKNERDNVLENNKYLREYIKAHEHSELVDKLNEMERTINSLDYELNDIYHPQPYKFEELKKGMWVWMVWFKEGAEKGKFAKILNTYTIPPYYHNDEDGEEHERVEFRIGDGSGAIDFDAWKFYPPTKAMEYQK